MTILGTGAGIPRPPSENALVVRPPWFPEPERAPPPPPSLTDEIKGVILTLREEEEAKARRLDTVNEEEEMEATREWQDMQVVVRYSLQPLQGQAGQSDGRSMASSAPVRVASRPGDKVAAAPTAAVHSDLGVRISAPPRTESSISVPMATNPVTRQLTFNTMSPQPVGAMRPVDPDG
eukprot:2202452-Pleurochrysis_carterae.AAC.1